MKDAYYNEHDPKMAAVLRVLIDQGHIAKGIVDERSISDVKPGDLQGFVQCHFFAGIGVWSHALRLARWPDTRPVWTGSCPCQPFSGAGKGLGFADERHLWPHWHWLIGECEPDTIFGEQVSDKGGTLWFDLVSADLEGSGYAIGALVAPAAGIGAPHMRHRTYFGAKRVGHALVAGLEGHGRDGDCGRQPGWFDPFKTGPIATASGAGGLADADRAKPEFASGQGSGSGQAAGGRARGQSDGRGELSAGLPATGPTNGFWRDADWLHGRDGKWRAVGSRTQSVVDGLTARMGCLLPCHIQDIELDVAEWAIRYQTDAGKALSDLWLSLSARPESERQIGGFGRIHETAILLAFLRQLTGQGWAFSEGVSCPSEEATQARLRMLWCDDAPARPPHQRGLDQQPTGEPTDPLHILSSILARHAQEAWGETIEAYATIGFPLTDGARNRVPRLHGYGNAIVAPLAATFIEAFDEVTA